MTHRLREKDCLVTMVDELRTARPNIYDADRFRPWAESMREAVQALPKLEQRWATVALIADDLAKDLPGAPLGMTYGWIARHLLTGADRAQVSGQARRAVQP